MNETTTDTPTEPVQTNTEIASAEPSQTTDAESPTPPVKFYRHILNLINTHHAVVTACATVVIAAMGVTTYFAINKQYESMNEQYEIMADTLDLQRAQVRPYVKVTMPKEIPYRLEDWHSTHILISQREQSVVPVYAIDSCVIYYVNKSTQSLFQVTTGGFLQAVGNTYPCDEIPIQQIYRPALTKATNVFVYIECKYIGPDSDVVYTQEFFMAYNRHVEQTTYPNASYFSKEIANDIAVYKRDPLLYITKSLNRATMNNLGLDGDQKSFTKSYLLKCFRDKYPECKEIPDDKLFTALTNKFPLCIPHIIP